MDQQQIGKWISSLRKEKKLTQEQLAERLGVSNRSVSRWENGRCMPDFSLLWDISRELNVSVEELLNGKRREERESSELLERMDVLLAWSGREKQNKAKRLSWYFGSGMACFLLSFGLVFLFPTTEESCFPMALAILGTILELLGFACNRKNGLLTSRELELLYKNGGMVEMREAGEMLRFAQKYQAADQKPYRAVFAEMEKSLEEGEEVVFTAVGSSYSRNELPLMWYPALAVTQKRLLLGGQRMKGMILVRYETESVSFEEITGVARAGTLGFSVVIRTSGVERRIEEENAEIAEEIVQELQRLLSKK